DVAANAGTVDHVLPVVGQTQIDQRLQQGIPNALFGPAPEADIAGSNFRRVPSSGTSHFSTEIPWVTARVQ
ncbi:MAG: hypothetical protein KYX64_07445, partial [Sphingopyxis sp.]|nr:hypothetical protein [Sphingopyxis sp.]